MSILFINACVRENSRTMVLAKSIMKDMTGDVVEVDEIYEMVEKPSVRRTLLNNIGR